MSRGIPVRRALGNKSENFIRKGVKEVVAVEEVSGEEEVGNQRSAKFGIGGEAPEREVVAEDRERFFCYRFFNGLNRLIG